jgi:hypothetical protein
MDYVDFLGQFVVSRTVRDFDFAIASRGWNECLHLPNEASDPQIVSEIQVLHGSKGIREIRATPHPKSADTIRI